MADCEVEEVSGCNRLVAKTLPNVKISNIPKELPALVLGQGSPQLLQTFQSPCQLEPLIDGVRICPLALVYLTPGTPVHYSSQRLVKLLIAPMRCPLYNHLFTIYILGHFKGIYHF